MRVSQISTILATLAATTIAIPTKRQITGYTLELSSTIPALAGLSVNANGGNFWVGKDTSSFCPEGENCSIFLNSTVVSLNSASGTAVMSSEIAGGQDIYVAEAGELMFTEPHTEGMFPAGSFTTNFSIGCGNEFVWNGPETTGWYVCWGGSLPVQILANVVAQGSCADNTPVDIKVSPVFAPGAFEYE